MEERKEKIGERNSNASSCSRDRQTYNIGLPSVVWRHKGSMWLLILAVSHMDPTYLCKLWHSRAHKHTHAQQPLPTEHLSHLNGNNGDIYSPPPGGQASCHKALSTGRDFQRWRAVCGRGQLFETGSEMPTWPLYLRPFGPWETITEAYDVSTAVKAKTGVEINRGSRRRWQSFFLLLGGGVSPFDGWASLKKEKYLEEGLQTEQKEIKNQVRSDPMRESGITSLFHQTRCNCKIGLNT